MAPTVSVTSGDAAPEAELEMHRVYAAEPSAARLNALVERHRPQAERLAARMYRGREPLEDLTQVAMEALVTALQRFDPDRGVPFRAYAEPTIVGMLKRHYRDHGWSIRVPRSAHETALATRDTSERLTATNQRMPTSEELWQALDLEPKALDDARRAMMTREPESLDAPTPEGQSQADLVGSLDGDLGQVSEHVTLIEALGELDSSELEVILFYYVDGLSQDQIAARCGISQMQVSRELQRTLRRLRHRMS